MTKFKTTDRNNRTMRVLDAVAGGALDNCNNNDLVDSSSLDFGPGNCFRP